LSSVTNVPSTSEITADIEWQRARMTHDEPPSSSP
jgi:hypothetical protein